MKQVFSMLIALALLTAPGIGQQNWPLVYIDAAETVDSGNSREKAAAQVDFGTAIAAALLKKKTPVTVVTDREKAQWIIESTSAQKQTRTGDLFINPRTVTEFEAAFKVVDMESTAVVFGYNVKRTNFQSAAEAFADSLKKHLEPKKK